MYLQLVFGLIALHFSALTISRYVERQLAQRALGRDHEFGSFKLDMPWDVFGIAGVVKAVRSLLSNSSLPRLSALFAKHGETYVGRVLSQRIVFTCDPKNINQIQIVRLSDYNSSVGVRDHILKPIIPHGLIALDGEEWRLTRQLYVKLLSNTRSIFSCEIHEEIFQNMKDYQIPSDGGVFDMQPVFKKSTLDTACLWVLGEHANFLSGRPSACKDFGNNLTQAKEIMARHGRLGPAHLLYSKKPFHAAIRAIHRHVDAAIEKALALKQRADEKGMDVVDMQVADGTWPTMLARMTRLTTDPVALRSLATTVLIASTDSTTSLLVSTFWLLARHEHDYRKLRESILAIAGTTPPTYDQLRAMSSLRNVFNEAMRLYPPVPVNAKKAKTNTWLPSGGGPDGKSSIFVSKGDTVAFSAWACHRRSETFGTDADDFRPSRWEEFSADVGGFFPFNLGPRNCPGQHWAKYHASYIAVRIIQTYAQLKTDDPRGFVEQLGLSMLNSNGLVISLKA